MAITQIRGSQILDESIGRVDLNATVPGNAVIKKVILAASLAAQGMTLTQTGIDSGTGDVTLGGTLTAAAPAGFNAGSWTAPLFNAQSATIATWTPPAGSASAPGITGFPGASISGTATGRVVVLISPLARAIRQGYVSSATVGAVAGQRFTQNLFGLGTDTAGGFFVQINFGCSDAATVANARQFVGLQSSLAAPTNVEPATLTNCVGVGHGAADTNLKIYFGGSAAQAPIDLGANFPANTLATDHYILTLYAPLNATVAGYKVGWHVQRVGTTFLANGVLTGVIGTALPSLVQPLTINSFRTNNASALAVGLDIGQIFLAALR